MPETAVRRGRAAKCGRARRIRATHFWPAGPTVFEFEIPDSEFLIPNSKFEARSPKLETARLGIHLGVCLPVLVGRSRRPNCVEVGRVVGRRRRRLGAPVAPCGRDTLSVRLILIPAEERRQPSVARPLSAAHHRTPTQNACCSSWTCSRPRPAPSCEGAGSWARK